MAHFTLGDCFGNYGTSLRPGIKMITLCLLSAEADLRHCEAVTNALIECLLPTEAI